MYTGSPPFFHHVEGTPEIRPAISIPSGFRNIVGASFVSPYLSELLFAANCDTQVKAFSGYEGTTLAELAFSDMQCSLVQHHIDLLGTRSARSIPGTDTQAFEECVCLGVWAFRIRMLRSVPPDPSTCSNVGYKLKTALMASVGLIEWHDHLALLLWITFVGAHTTPRGALRHWYVLLLKAISAIMCAESWESSRRILRNFLWIERCECFGEHVWLEVDNAEMVEGQMALDRLLQVK